jgi:hypothetical protein
LIYREYIDRHKRPYKCLAHDCKNLKGFATRGELRRHEIGIHKIHSAPQLNFPFPTCKRHIGKGFLRQDNLSEHIRRRHTQHSDESKKARKRKVEADFGVPVPPKLIAPSIGSS